MWLILLICIVFSHEKNDKDLTLVKSKLEENNKKIQLSLSEIGSLRNQVEGTFSKIEKLEKDTKDLGQKVLNLETSSTTQFKALQSSLDSKIGQNNVGTKAIKKKYKDLETKFNELKKDKEALEATVRTNAELVETLKKDLSKVKSVVSKQNQKLKKQKESKELDQLKTQFEKLLKNQDVAFQAKLDELEQKTFGVYAMWLAGETKKIFMVIYDSFGYTWGLICQKIGMEDSWNEARDTVVEVGGMVLNKGLDLTNVCKERAGELGVILPKLAEDAGVYVEKYGKVAVEYSKVAWDKTYEYGSIATEKGLEWSKKYGGVALEKTGEYGLLVQEKSIELSQVCKEHSKVGYSKSKQHLKQNYPEIVKWFKVVEQNLIDLNLSFIDKNDAEFIVDMMFLSFVSLIFLLILRFICSLICCRSQGSKKVTEAGNMDKKDPTKSGEDRKRKSNKKERRGKK